MNNKLKIVFIIFCLWAVFLILAFAGINIVEDKIFNNPRNKRVLYQTRGKILDRNGVVMAYGQGEERKYPLGSAASHVIGYVNPKIGAGGEIEQKYADKLMSSTKSMLLYFQSYTDTIRNNSLQTTLDAKIQKAADNALSNYRGAVVVLDASTGEVLAMVSHPDFDPEHIDNNWERYKEIKEGPLFNRAVNGLYPAGSVWKIIDASLLLDRKDESFECSGSLIVGNKKLTCPHSHGTIHGLDEAFAKSCNIYFQKRGLDEINQKDFIRISMSFMKKDADLAIRSEKEYLLSLIGQGNVLITPMSGALLAATIANNGLKPEPMLTKGNASTERIFSEDEAMKIRDMMRLTVLQGTGRGLSSFVKKGFSVGLKTGTAEKNISKQDKTNIAWMVGFAGKDKQEIAFSIVVENTNVYASEVCSPIAASILNAYFSKYRR